MDKYHILFAMSLTILAGLSTGIGSALAYFTRSTNTRFLSGSLGFSAGVMIYVSFVEILAKARTALVSELGNVGGSWAAVLTFFGGILLVAVIDRLIPSYENPHEIRRIEAMDDLEEADKSRRLFRMGTFTALAIAIHNFPEGLATFTAALADASIGIPIAIAIAIHNIPEGIAVSIPVFYATGSRRKAFAYSLASGMAEPAGALVGYLLLRSFFNNMVLGISFAAVAGIMVFISLDELLPTAEAYGEHHVAIYGLLAGMAVMAAGLLLFVS